MSKPCTFEDLPIEFQEHITAVCDTFEVLKCKRTDDKEFKCFVKDDDIIGLFLYREKRVSCIWLGKYDIEILRSALESTRP
ncbi:hypothetical protein [Desulfosporosinus nitroreducens]|uniref:hypothetical protein n=1 Tax=Desulfosporosinus nitroreducens TaxID=2018668 RepID=UPI00207CFF18|nr:hypothetical protein [Desulfosporosinus nitroreducens]MCO1599809.1 hypothetical protein [Desulfosporosinus nitroreducens]